MKKERTASAEEVKEMTKYYIQIARYFLSTGRTNRLRSDSAELRTSPKQVPVSIRKKVKKMKKEEVKEMTRYYVQIAKYFLSTSVLTGFGVALQN